MIESKIAYYSDFPKPGVTFKDLSFVIGDPEMLKVLVRPYKSFNNQSDKGNGSRNESSWLGQENHQGCWI